MNVRVDRNIFPNSNALVSYNNETINIVYICGNPYILCKLYLKTYIFNFCSLFWKHMKSSCPNEIYSNKWQNNWKKAICKFLKKNFQATFFTKIKYIPWKLLFKPYVGIQCITVILIDSDLVQNQCNKYFFLQKISTQGILGLEALLYQCPASEVQK